MIDIRWYDATQHIILLEYPPKNTWDESDRAFATIQTWVLASPHPITIVYHFPDHYTVSPGVLSKVPRYFQWYYEHIEQIERVYFVNTHALMRQFGKMISGMFAKQHRGQTHQFLFVDTLADIPQINSQ